MFRVFFWCVLCLAFISTASAKSSGDPPLVFEPNRGQASAEAKFVARARGYVVSITAREAILGYGPSAVSMHLVGARSSKPEGINALGSYSNYFYGNDSRRWIQSVPHYARVRVQSALPKIDLTYYGAERKLEYDLDVAPGADTGSLALEFAGAQSLKVSPNGDLLIRTASGDLVQHRPVASQGASAIQASYVVRGSTAFLRLGSYDHTRPLKIDPIIDYSTYLSGSSYDLANGIAVDSSGNAYVSGYTTSLDFPVTAGVFHGPPQNNIFVTKLNPTGSAIIYSTYIGGTNNSEANAIAIDSLGNAYLTGQGGGPDFPVVPPGLTGASNPTSVVVLKLNAAGAVVYSGQFGSPGANAGYSEGYAIAVDSGGNAFVAGRCLSIPTTSGAFQPNHSGGGPAAFVLKLNGSGSTVYATYLGGATAGTGAFAVAVDSSGSAYVAGSTSEVDFPVTPQAFSTTLHGTSDAFISKLNPSGSSLAYSTFLGGSSDLTTFQEGVSAIAVDGNGNAYVTGVTASLSFPTTQGALSRARTAQAVTGFVTKLNASGNALLYSTYLGGLQGIYIGSTFGDYPTGIVVNAAGNATVVGRTTSADFPTTPGALKQAIAAPIENYGSASDGFLTQLNPSGSALVYSTLLGSSNGDSIAGVATDSSGVFYVAGTTLSLIFPTTPGAFQVSSQKPQPISALAALNSAFVTKIDLSSPTACNVQLSSSGTSVPAQGGTGLFTFTVPAGCPWEIVPSTESIAIFPSLHGFNNGTANYTVPYNTSSVAQTDTITVTGGTLSSGTNVFTINRAASSCATPLIDNTSLIFGTSGGPGSVSVTLPSGCPWGFYNPLPWVSVISSVSNSGPATFAFVVQANNFAARQGTITVAGQPITISQAGGNCTATLLSSAQSFGPQGGTGQIAFTVNPASCAWTTYSLAPWIQLASTAASGTGNGTVPFIVASNPGTLPRSAQLNIGPLYLNITQAAGPSGAALSYSQAAVVAGGPGYGLAVDANQNLYVADYWGQVIRVVSPNGTITTVAGGGTANPGDGGAATAAALTGPRDMVIDASGNVYFSDGYRVREVSNGIISTVAGTGNPGFSGDSGPATAATLDFPFGLALDAGGNLFVADEGNNRIRKISNGTITTIAGDGTPASTGDGMPAINAEILYPTALTVDTGSNLYILEADCKVRKISSGVITSVAGNGDCFSQGPDNVPATSSALYYAQSITTDVMGSLYILESGRVGKVTPNNTIQTIGQTELVNNSLFNPHNLPPPNGIVVDGYGNVVFTVNEQVYRLAPNPTFCSYTVSTPPAIPITGGPVSVQVTTTTTCPWNAASNLSWATLASPANATGSGTVSFTISTNTGKAPRTGTIAIAGQTVTLNQGPRNSTITYDIEGTGVQDLIVYNPTSPGYEYSLISAGNGSYSGIAHAGVNAGPSAFDTVLQGDFNGDGKSDVLFYSSASGMLEVGIGNGFGGFTYAVPVSIGAGYNVIARGDFNADGKTDLLIYRRSDGAAYVGLSNGDGTFNFIAQLFSAGFTTVAVADYNGDGVSDVILYNNQSVPYSAYYLQGDGSGHFINATALFFGPGYNVYPADLNGDGKSDFILYRPNDGTIFVAIGNGTSFSYHYLLYSPGFTAFKIGDVNGDGIPDLVLYNNLNANGYLLLGDGKGNFPTGYSLFFGPGMDFVDLRDFNGDGKQDVIIYRSADGTSFTGISNGIGFNYTYNYFGPGRIIAQ